MKSAEDFLTDYFQDRTQTLRSHCESWKSLNEKFFAAGCQKFDWDKSVEDSANERIVETDLKGDLARVVTTGSIGERHKLRYELRRPSTEWAISNIELECGICHGTGKRREGTAECKICKGAGWTSFCLQSH